ncbi:hypothetical protein [Pseudotabrizicola alkalilacus]|uniref:Glycosyl transferase family 1 domain-containing protein n=1 Tax=Pseudotabrizicola alkalilacus TaxID=2305252 RepID=A0A411Z6Q3_9RHOB|nr:hypothetical protein [Pseudotabrizicola alkalilacus]RGP38770.1 hypothetical protein D1012_01195 [Pseudotabrizicola alkalilacus]
MTDAISNAAFVSFNFGKGLGGHYFSMAETIRSGIFADPLVIDLGFRPAPPLDGLRTHVIYHGWVGHWTARRRLRDAVAKANTQVVFCYDIHAYDITAWALANTPTQVVYVKCGGPTLTLYTPKPHNLIVYSDEDDAFFERRLAGAIRAKIPNRVSETSLAAKQIPLSPEAKAWLDAHNGAEKIVCIARLSHSYANKIQRAVDYLEAQRRAGRQATLTLIGYVQHEEVMNDLKTLNSEYVQILTDPFHTKDAGRFLSNFDTAITTGRGTVEAVLLGVNVLVPYDASRKLARLTSASYTGLFRTNFSGRAKPEEVKVTGYFSQTDMADVRERIRNDFAIENAGPKFRGFLDRLRPPRPVSVRDRFLGYAYFWYRVTQEKSRVLRSFSRNVLKQRLLPGTPK